MCNPQMLKLKLKSYNLQTKIPNSTKNVQQSEKCKVSKKSKSQQCENSFSSFKHVSIRSENATQSQISKDLLIRWFTELLFFSPFSLVPLSNCSGKFVQPDLCHWSIRRVSESPLCSPTWFGTWAISLEKVSWRPIRRVVEWLLQAFFLFINFVELFIIFCIIMSSPTLNTLFPLINILTLVMRINRHWGH